MGSPTFLFPFTPFNRFNRPQGLLVCLRSKRILRIFHIIIFLVSDNLCTFAAGIRKYANEDERVGSYKKQDL